MSTKQQTQSTVQYDSGAKSQYDQNVSTSNPILRDYAQNPFGNPFFQRQLGMLSGQASQMGNRNTQNIMANARQSGMSSNAVQPFLQSQLAAAGRGTSSLQNQAQFQAMSQAFQNQWNALQGLQSFQPLMTGQSSTSKTSGTGTWLPQLAGAAIGAAGNFFAPGLGAAMSAGKVASAGGGMLASPTFNSPSFWNTVSPSPMMSNGMGSLGYYNPLTPNMAGNPFGVGLGAS